MNDEFRRGVKSLFSYVTCRHVYSQMYSMRARKCDPAAWSGKIESCYVVTVKLVTSTSEIGLLT